MSDHFLDAVVFWLAERLVHVLWWVGIVLLLLLVFHRPRRS